MTVAFILMRLKQAAPWIAAGILGVTLVFATWEWRGSNTLLDRMASIQPGIDLGTVKAQLGQPLSSFTDPDSIQMRGSVKDRAFCKDKKLYWFEGSKPPWRVIEVYTDANDKVVYVSWQSL